MIPKIGVAPHCVRNRTQRPARTIDKLAMVRAAPLQQRDHICVLQRKQSSLLPT